MKNISYSLMNQLQWNQLRIQIKDMPENIYAVASGNTISLSRKFMEKMKTGVISRHFFLFVFLHELVHIAQQAILSLKMTRQELNDYVVKNRISLEEDANEIASKLVFSKKRKSLLNLFFDKTKCKSINLCNSMDVPCQYWMVDGLLAVVGAGEVNCTSEIEKRKNSINNIIQENSANETMIDHLKANDWMDLQASAKSDGIHETYTKDAYNDLFHYLKETYKIDNRQIRIKKTSKKNIEIHVISTENVLPKIVTRKIVYDDLIIGSSFNDRRFMTNARFVVEYGMHSDTFLNSSHRGKMQFLHSMDCSNGNRKKNREKILRWVEFCLDVFNNVDIKINNKTKKIQDVQLNDYVKSLKKEDFLNEMLEELTKFWGNTYDNDKIKDFFGDDCTSNKDPGSVALGSVAHMLQDSFALSHTKRCLDPFLICPFGVAETPDAVIDYTKAEVKYVPITEKLLDRNDLTETSHFYELSYDRSTKDTPESQENFRLHLAKHAMPVILFANYTTQNGDTFGGKHSKADIFVRRYNADDNKFNNFYGMTLNASMARDCTEAFLYMAIMGYSNSEIKEFIKTLYPIALEEKDNRIIERSISSGGLQYYKDPELVKDNLKDTWNRYGKKLEEMMCYNTKESLSTRTLVFSYMLSELEYLINKAIEEYPRSGEKKKVRDFVNEYCLKHYNEIIIDIMKTTMLLSNFINNISSYKNNSKKTIEYKLKICQKNARFLKNIIEKIVRFDKSLQEKKKGFEISTDLYLSDVDLLQEKINSILSYPKNQQNEIINKQSQEKKQNEVDPAELNNINHIVNGFCKIYNTDWEEFNSIISDESKNFTAKAPIVPVGYNPSTRDDSAKQEELRIEKLNNAVKICREKTSDALQSNSGTEMQRKRKLADYCMNNKNSVLDYIQYLLKQFYDQWLLPDGSGERFPYVIDRKYKIDDNTIGNEDVGPRNGKYVDKVNPQSSDIKKSPVINDEWNTKIEWNNGSEIKPLKISEIITTTEKKYNNNFYKNRYVSINGKDDGSDSVLITDFYTKDKETSSEGGYIKIKNEIYKNDEDLGIKWFKDTENGREQTFDLQLYYKNSTYANSQGGKGCPEMMQEVAKELLKRFNELNIAKEKSDSNKLNDSEKKIINKEIERLENLKTLFMNRYKDVFTANHQQYRFKDYIHDLGIGMDCSGYVTRALVFIMNKLQIPGFEQIKTIGPAYGRLKTNCYGLYNEEYDKKNKGSKIIYTASKNDTFNELYQKIQVGDIEMKDKPGGEFHVRIITEVGTRGDDKVAYYKDHQSSSANGRCGIIETTVVEVAPQNDKTIKVYSEYKKSEGKYYKFARPHVFNDEKQLKKYFKEMLIRTGSNPN